MLIAIDEGYSHTKAAAADGRRVMFPSVVGEVQYAHLELDLSAANGYMQIETPDGGWLVGKAAIEQSGQTTRRQDRGWIDTPEYMALMLAGISGLTSATHVSLEIVTGLPVGYYADKDGLIKRLRGVHTFKRTPKAHENQPNEQRVTISSVVVLPQGLAAVLSDALDSSGRVRPGPVAEDTIGLVDIGGHTVNFSTFKQLKEIARQTASIEAGMWGPLTEIERRINAAFPGQELRGHEVVEAMRRGTIRHFGEEYDISDIVEAALRPFIKRIMAEISQVWGSAARLGVLLIAGGGAEVVGPELIKQYPHARIVEEPQWANVRGYLRFGLFQQRQAG